MPISFKARAKSGYFVSEYRGHVSGEEHIEAFRQFLRGSEWTPGMNELAIASDVASSSVSYASLRKLLAFKKTKYLEYGIKHVRIAIYAPGDLAFGTARMYNALTEESPEEVRAFRDIREAIRWLKG